jgi:hypothetical protein
VRAAQRRPRSQGSPAGRRAFLVDSADHVVGIGKIELRNRSNPVQPIALGHRRASDDPDKTALIPAAT